MAIDQIPLKITGTKTLRKGQLEKDIIEVAQDDYLRVLRGIAAQEIDAQIRLGNRPSNLIVDGKANIPIDQALYSIVAYFTDAKAMIAAIEDARATLMGMGRTVSGKTASKVSYYQSTGRNPPRRVQVITESTITQTTGLYVTVPVAWVRKWQYFNPAGEHYVKKSKNKRYQKKKMKVMVAQSVFERVASQVQRRYPWLMVKFCFIDVPNLNPAKTPVTSIPAVVVRLKRKGQV